MSPDQTPAPAALARTSWWVRSAVALAVAAALPACSPIGDAAAQPLRTGNEPASPFTGLFRAAPWQAPAAAPANHTANFAYQHGTAASDPGSASCTGCHQETFCTDCHTGLVDPIAIHPPGYLTFHGPEALAGTAECASCHTPDRFCVDCHQQGGFAPDDNGQVAPGFNAHPADWLDASSPFSHGPEARSNLLSCMGCHSGTDCADCHQFVNPHGDNFRIQCRDLLEAGSPVCGDCHNSDATLPLELLPTHPDCQR